MLIFRAQGKLLITGEYLVLHGAQALCLPLTKMHQTMELLEANPEGISWQAQDHLHQVWINLELDQNFQPSRSLNPPEEKLQSILKEISRLKPELFHRGLRVKTQMNFSPQWGLGSSSTFISLLSQWSELPAWQLQQHFFGGSGYDVACATAKSPLVYELKNSRPHLRPTNWSPSWREELRFVYLGKKKNTQKALRDFAQIPSSELRGKVPLLNQLTQAIVMARELAEFQDLIRQHEALIAGILRCSPIQDELFPDFPGTIKSLGAWGGDFILAAAQKPSDEYFKSRGLDVIFRWSDLTDF
jgi:mevalonate kinase